ncbi:MAG: hypothetical protein LBN02_03620 [Oscillospiraceae bacterium]|jgi:hypothetical protein|nr:hypothetical protein [Oscillospiraceae bacterium]
MAEICVDCMKKSARKNGEPFSEREWVISDDADICEWCGEYKRVIIKRRENLLLKMLKILFFRRH